jgi:hypothetical protein
VPAADVSEIDDGRGGRLRRGLLLLGRHRLLLLLLRHLLLLLLLHHLLLLLLLLGRRAVVVCDGRLRLRLLLRLLGHLLLLLLLLLGCEGLLSGWCSSCCCCWRGCWLWGGCLFSLLQLCMFSKQQQQTHRSNVRVSVIRM